MITKGQNGPNECHWYVSETFTVLLRSIWMVLSAGTQYDSKKELHDYTIP